MIEFAFIMYRDPECNTRKAIYPTNYHIAQHQNLNMGYMFLLLEALAIPNNKGTYRPTLILTDSQDVKGLPISNTRSPQPRQLRPSCQTINASGTSPPIDHCHQRILMVMLHFKE